MHLKKIIHRDLKPDNILMRENKNSLLYDIVFADLGLSVKEEVIRNSRPYGTPGFVAPEILLRGFQSYKGDIFSIGCILFRILTGANLFSGANYLEDNTDWKVRNLRSKVLSVSHDCFDLLQSLLQDNQYSRPFARKSLKHAWFKDHET
jgi:calcium-dependent protein kinase